MINLQEMKLRMYLTLRALLRAYTEVLAKLPNTTEYLAALDAVILSINNNLELKQKGTKTIVNQQKVQKALLISRILEDSLKLKTFASYKNDSLLTEFCSYTERQLDRMSETELVLHAKALYSNIGEVLEQLTRYQLSADTQASLLEIITGFEMINPELSNAKGNYKNITGDLNDNFKSGDALVAKIDIEVELIKNSDTQVYNLYRTKRKLDYSSDTNDVVGHILDSETGAGIPNANISLQLNDSTAAPILKLSADKGGFQIKTITPGIYTVTVTKIGYITQTITVTITGDNQVVVDVRLVKG